MKLMYYESRQSVSWLRSSGVLGLLFAGSFQLVADVIQLFLVTLLERLFIGLVLDIHQLHLLLHLL